MQDVPELGVRVRLGRPPRLDVERDDGGAGGEGAAAAARPVADGRVVTERRHERRQLLVASRDRTPADRAIGGDEIDDAPVGDDRDRGLGGGLDHGRDVVGLIEAQRGVGQHPGDLLRPSSRLGELVGLALAGADPALGLDPRRDVVERVDRDRPPVGELGAAGLEHRPLRLAAGVEPEADEHRLRRHAGDGASPGQERAVERVAFLVDHLEAVHHVARRNREHLGRRAEAGQTCGILVDEQELTARVLDGDPGGDPLEDRPQVGRQCIRPEERRSGRRLIRTRAIRP